MTRHSGAKRALIYCRVSSKKQTIDGDGLNSQEHRCRQYAAERGYVVEAVFPDSMTGSGDFMARPGMVALLSYLDAQSGDEFTVIFDDLKRFARDTEFHINLRRQLKARNANVECLNFKFEDSPEGRFIETIIAAQGQLEREQIGRQSIQKMHARLEKGFWVFRAPVGYQYVSAKGGGKVLKRDPILAPIVTDALNGYASGRFATQTEVLRFLEGQPAYPKDTPSGGIRAQTIARLLGKPVYAGLVGAPKWRIPWKAGEHDGLISVETFQKIQKRLKEGVYAPVRADAKDDFALRGAISCSSCGRPMTAGWAKGKYKKYPYYWCQKPGCSEKSKTIARDKVEREFANVLNEVVPAEWMGELFRAMLKKRWEQYIESGEAQREQVLQLITDNETAKQELVERVLESRSAAVISAYEKKIEHLETQTLVLQEKLQKTFEPKLSFEDLFEHSMRFISAPIKLWESGVWELRRLVLRLTFAKCLPYKRGEGFELLPVSSPFNIINDLGGKMLAQTDHFNEKCKMVPRGRIELPTSPLPRVRSTTELPRH